MDFEKKSEATAFERPKILYHGSSLGDIEIFEPRAKTVRDEKEGPVVFATPDKAYATLFLVESDDSWTQKVNFEGVHTIVISDRERYEKAD
ncbi:MAG TPA: hypothetical protein VFT82_00470, partial [Candidatus Paceibacterota bacterium]|nr:hypothetical protein [Candidatus Paceibacterota bacterium]